MYVNVHRNYQYTYSIPRPMSGKSTIGSALFIVAKLTYNASYGHPFNRNVSLMLSGDTVLDYWGSTSGTTYAIPAQDQTNPVVYALVCLPTGCKMYVNDPSIVRATSAFDGAAYETDVWMRFWTSNTLGELRLYEGNMTDNQRITVFSELKTKWGIP